MYDVCVIGAGPAGSSAGHTCASNGLKTAVFDGKKFPRPKPCGGAFSQRGINWLKFPLPAELIEGEVFGARIYFRDFVLARESEERLAVLITREKFDAFLLKKARESGAEAFEGEEILEVATSGQNVRIKTAKREAECRILIVAQGALGKFIKKVRKPDAKFERGFCLVAEFPCNDEEYMKFGNFIDLYFGDIPEGYGWVFCRRNCFSVGIGGTESLLKDPLRSFREFCRLTGFPDDVKPRGCVIPYGGIMKKLSSNRMLLAGDSAAFVDPFSGEGLSFAVRSGQIAAEVACRAIKENDYSDRRLNEYGYLCNKEFGTDMRNSRLMTKVFHWNLDFFYGMFYSDPRLISDYFSVALGRMSCAKFIKKIGLRIPFAI